MHLTPPPPHTSCLQAPVNPGAIDVSPDGSLVVVGHNDHSISVHAVDSGVVKKRLSSKARGIGRVKFTHAGSAIIASSNSTSERTRRGRVCGPFRLRVHGPERAILTG